LIPKKIVIFYPRYFLGDGGVTNTLKIFVESLYPHTSYLSIFAGSSIRIFNKNRMCDKVFKTNLRYFFTIVNEIYKSDLIILVSGLSISNYLISLICKTLGRKYLVQPHGALHKDIINKRSNLRKVFVPVEKSFIDGSSFVHYLNSFECANSYFDAPQKRKIIIPVGTSLYKEILWTGTGNYFVWYGRFDIFIKGIDILLIAWSKISPQLGARLILAGRANNADTLTQIESLIRDLKIEKYVEIRGSLDSLEEKWNLILPSKGLIFSSRIDANSMVIAECASWGVPIVISDQVVDPYQNTVNGSTPFISCDFSNDREMEQSLLEVEKNGPNWSRQSFQYSRIVNDPEKNIRKFLEVFNS